ncbi:MAG: carboxylate--amine ligase, partial [Acidobacteriota bacterium]|nr:carboxylate--amine ligase [Acidobacteriota bacterium]
MENPTKLLLLFTNKLGYQTRSFEQAAQTLGVNIIYVSDRCHKLEDPWGDHAIAVHFESPQAAAAKVIKDLRKKRIDGIIAIGDRPVVAAAYA